MHINGDRYKYEHIIHLLREVNELKSRLQPHDTGHLHTTIAVIEGRIAEIQNSLRTSDEPEEFHHWGT
jgi:hypothetical protein